MVTNDNRSIALFGNDWCFNAKSFPLYQFHAKVFARKNFCVKISYQLSVINKVLG